MQSILFLSAALSGAPVTDEVQRQLGLLASTINSQTSSPRQYLKSTKAKVEAVYPLDPRVAI